MLKLVKPKTLLNFLKNINNFLVKDVIFDFTCKIVNGKKPNLTTVKLYFIIVLFSDL